MTNSFYQGMACTFLQSKPNSQSVHMEYLIVQNDQHLQSKTLLGTTKQQISALSCLVLNQARCYPEQQELTQFNYVIFDNVI